MNYASYSQSNTGPIQAAQGSQNPHSADPDTCIASDSFATQSKDARSGLQSMSGVPDGSEGKGVEAFPSASNVQVNEALQAPPTALNPQRPLESFKPIQPEDLLGITNLQPAALESKAEALTQLIATAGTTLGVTLGASPAQDLLGIGQVDAAMAPAHLAQPDAGAGASGDSAPAHIVEAPADSLPSQATTIPKAALGTITAIDARKLEMGTP